MTDTLARQGCRCASVHRVERASRSGVPRIARDQIRPDL